MKNIYILTVLAFFSFSGEISAQEFDEFTALDLKKIAKDYGWKPSKRYKGISDEKMNLFFLEINSDYPLMKQININSWSVCFNIKTDNLELYNYYYKDITRNVYNRYCKEISALMQIDGVIQ